MRFELQVQTELSWVGWLDHCHFSLSLNEIPRILSKVFWIDSVWVACHVYDKIILKADIEVHVIVSGYVVNLKHAGIQPIHLHVILLVQESKAYIPYGNIDLHHDLSYRSTVDLPSLIAIWLRLSSGRDYLIFLRIGLILRPVETETYIKLLFIRN